MTTTTDDPEQATPRSGSRHVWGRLLITVLVLVVIGVWVLLERGNAPEPVPPPTREETAVAFLEAVAAGDAERALAMSAVEQEGPFLTAEALQASLEQAPISEITVQEVSGDDVVLAHQLGDREVTTTIPTQTDQAGQWQVSQAAAKVQLRPTPAKVPLLVDGQPTMDTADDKVLLFPGLHTLSTGAPWLDYATSELVIGDPDDPPPVTVEATVTEEAEGAVRDAVRQRLDDCAASGELAPERCPWNLSEPEGQPFEPGSVSLSFVDDPMAGFTAPELGGDDALAEGRVSFTLAVAAQVSVGGTVQDYSDQVQVDTGYTTDLFTEGPDFIWSN